MTSNYVDYEDLSLASEVIADTRAEETVIAAILMQPEVLLGVSAVLQPQHFFWGFNRQMFAAMLSLYEAGTPIDLVTVMGEVEKHGGAEDVFSAQKLMDMATHLPYATIENIVTHANTVHDKFRLRSMVAASQKVVQAAYAPDAHPDQVFYQIDEWYSPAAPLPKRDTSIGAALNREMERFSQLTQAREEGRVVGFYTGRTIDHILRGMLPGNFITVAARPGMGKTTFAVNELIWLAEKGIPCLFWSLEMSTSELTQKMVSYYSGIDSSRVRDCLIMEEEVPLYMEAMNAANNLPVHIYSPAGDDEVDDEVASSINHFRTVARLMVAQHGIKVIFIDYLQLLEGKGDNRVQEVSKITRSLKRFALRYGVVIVALSQLNRNVEARADKTPNLSDLRESGSIEQDSDVVAFLYRDDYYNPESEQQGLVDIIFAKNRHGKTGVVTMYFKRELSQFRDLAIERTYLPDDVFRQDVTTETVEAIR